MEKASSTKTQLGLLCAMLISSFPTFICAQPIGPQATEIRPILGILAPGHTTVDDFKEALSERGCKFKEDTAAMDAKKVLTVKEGCFDLPGNPEIIVSGQTVSLSSPIDALWMNYHKDELGTFYDTYLNALSKAYGQPFVLQSPPQGRREAIWMIPQDPLLVIYMDEKGQGGKSQVIYMMGETAKSFLQERGMEPEPAAHKDLDLL